MSTNTTCAPGHAHGLRCRNEAVRDRDDFVARTHAEGLERHGQRVGAVRETDTVCGAAESRRTRIRTLDVGAADEGGLRDNASDRGVNRAAYRVVLGLQI